MFDDFDGYDLGALLFIMVIIFGGGICIVVAVDHVENSKSQAAREAEESAEYAKSVAEHEIKHFGSYAEVIAVYGQAPGYSDAQAMLGVVVQNDYDERLFVLSAVDKTPVVGDVFALTADKGCSTPKLDMLIETKDAPVRF